MISDKFPQVLFLLLLLMPLHPSNVYAIGMAKVTVAVADEVGQPVPDADVRVCFYGGCLKKDAEKGKTDKEGQFSASASSYDGAINGAVEKNGYYYSGFHHDFHRNALGVWQPWNKEIKVVLRPKLNPVPMYVRDKWVQIPVIDKEVGFDLMKFDWVVPHGQGATSDLIFVVTRRFKNMNDFDVTMTMTFSNKYDGIQEIKTERGGDFNVGSELRLPRYAPESGYKAKLEKRLSTSDPKFGALLEQKTNYFYRVRSEVDEKGNFKRAMYGKIVDDVLIEPRGTATGKIRFTYYLNPDYTRNLEYDIDGNLFSPLPSREIPLRKP